MSNEDLIRKLIRGSIQRAIQESVAAVIVLIAFTVFLLSSSTGSLRYFGCLVILTGTGFIAGVVWSHALSYKLLRNHSAADVGFWREAFHTQARLLQWVPLWYCAPICIGAILFVAPSSSAELIPFLMVSLSFVIVCAGITALNYYAASKLREMAAQLTAAS